MQISSQWKNTKTDFPQQCFHELFEAQVMRTPCATAVVFQDEQLTYQELNCRANQLAHYLQTYGVGPEVPVGIYLEPSLEMIVGLLGILKAGGAYVPLDKEFPPERLTFMMTDTQMPILVTQQHLKVNLPMKEIQTVCLDIDGEAIAQQCSENPLTKTVPDNLAYIIYTSGSTGKPKGTLISHRGLVDYLNCCIQNYNLEQGEGSLVHSSIAFDMSITALFAPLLVGSKLEIVAETQGVEALYSTLCSRSNLSFVKVTPTHLSLLNQKLSPQDIAGRVQTLVIGGENLLAESLSLWQEAAPETKLVNEYGPTETVVASSIYLIPPDQPRLGSVPIGSPLANTQFYVLDEHGQPAPIGIPGELYIGGVGVARGYLNRPALTAERFIPDPFSDEPGARMYKTGDLVCCQADGNFEFLGRLDDQVKIRGYRIELGEIEAVLQKHPAVNASAVTPWEDTPGNQRLVAYVMPNSEITLTTSELRSFLKKQLPEYMVPSSFTLLKDLPLMPNGKLNRRALPSPDTARPLLEQAFVAPRTPIEEKLAAILAEILRLDRVGIYDNFFELGGQSLLATQVISRVRDIFEIELSMQSIFDALTVADLAKIIIEEKKRAKIKSPHFPSIQRISRDGNLPLSYSQERVWFVQQLKPENMAYNCQSILRFIGLLDVEALQKSLSEIVRRHEIYRTTFSTVNGRPIQIIHEAQPVHLPLLDLQTFPENQREAKAQKLIDEEIQKPFNIAQLPLVRWTLLQLSKKEHILINVEHHFLHDGWAFNVFLRELLELYQNFSVGQPSTLPELPIQYVDFAYWQRQWLQGETLSNQLTYWKQKLSGSPLILELPIARPRPSLQTFRGAASRIELPLSLCQSLRTLCRKEGTTLFVTLLTAFKTLLYRYTGQEDLNVGSSIANRRWRETEGLTGMLVNNIVLRTHPFGNLTFREFLHQVHQVALEAYAYQDVPFDKVVEILKPKRDLSYNPLFQHMFSFHDTPLPELNLPELDIELRESLNNGSAKFDMNIILIPRAEQRVGLAPKAGAEGITMLWEYNTDLFDSTSIERMIGHFQTLLEDIVINPSQQLLELSLLTKEERQDLIKTWKNTKTDFPQQCFHELFEAQVMRTPCATAVVFQDEQLTYQELNCRANQLAHYLQTYGVGPEVPVGIYLEPSLEMIVGLLGILKAGGAYVPLDKEFPPERLTFMMTDTQMPILVTQQHLKVNLPMKEIQTVCLDIDGEAIAQQCSENPLTKTVPDNLAYIIYTSGSTGKPKGTLISHRGLVDYLNCCIQNYNLEQGEGSLVHSSIAFDMSITALFAPLLVGSKLEIVAETQGVEALYSTLCSRSNLSFVKVTPTHLSLLNQKLSPQDIAGRVQTLVIGGENLLAESLSLWQEAAPETKLVNEYGPTETVVASSIYLIPPDQPRLGSVPIGSPLANTQFYVLDEHGQPAPIGIPGELYIGGVGVARGYLNRPALTAERFIPDPFSDEPGARMYKTGDLVCCQADGNFEFLGRLDDQVKIRGYRIELGEIEAVLQKHPAVNASAVTPWEDTPGNQRLVAYVMPNSEITLTTSELRSFLKKQLPEYMVPSSFTLLKDLPLMPNGKLNRRALPSPDTARPLLEQAFVAPRTPIEEKLAAILAEILRLDRVGIYDNFFELGGQSLLATQVISRINSVFQIILPLHKFFEKSTVASLTSLIAQNQEQQSAMRTKTIHRINRGNEEQMLENIDQLSDEEVQSLLENISVEGDFLNE